MYNDILLVASFRTAVIYKGVFNKDKESTGTPTSSVAAGAFDST
jgi:hypothetical protein